MKGYIDKRFNNHPYDCLDANIVKSLYGDDVYSDDQLHFVMWSGGTDSTLLLYELLDTFGSEKVVAISYRYPWLLEKKADKEEMYREAFKAKMKLKGPRYSTFKHTVFDIVQNDKTLDDKGNNVRLYPQPGGLPQSIGWLLHIPIYCPNGSFIYDGGISDDDLTKSIDYYRKTFKNIAKSLDRNIVLRNPYLYCKKVDIIERLINYDIYDVTWFCEMVKNNGNICGKCSPCITHLNVLTILKERSSSDLVRLEAAKQYEKLMKMIENNSKVLVDLEDK